VISVPAASCFSWDSPWWCKDGDEITKVGAETEGRCGYNLRSCKNVLQEMLIEDLQIPLVLINNNSSNFFCSHQLPKNIHQIPLVPISNPSISFCSHQVPKQFPSNSPCSYQVSIKFLLFPLLWRIGRSAQRWMVRLMRHLGWVLNGVQISFSTNLIYYSMPLPPPNGGRWALVARFFYVCLCVSFEVFFLCYFLCLFFVCVCEGGGPLC
jgi:hypothetical protein